MFMLCLQEMLNGQKLQGVLTSDVCPYVHAVSAGDAEWPEAAGCADIG